MDEQTRTETALRDARAMLGELMPFADQKRMAALCAEIDEVLERPDDHDEQMQIDRACLELFGWTELRPSDDGDYWEGRHPGGFMGKLPAPSTDPSCVVPLAEALRRRGFGVRMATAEGMWNVAVYRDGALVCQAQEFALPAGLALAAARAVGEEKPDNA